RHTRFSRDWSSDVCSSDLKALESLLAELEKRAKQAHVETQERAPKATPAAKDLPGLVVSERERATKLYNDAEKLRRILLSQQERSEERRVGKGCRTRWRRR